MMPVHFSCPRNNQLETRIKDPLEPVIFYEFIPPNAAEDPESLQLYAKYAADLIRNSKVWIDAINIPEIREEGCLTKKDARHLVAELRKILGSSVGFALNRATVYEEMPKQLDWLGETVKTHGIGTLILVGGESSKIEYPGLSVVDACRLVKAKAYDVLLGGITIPNRKNEAGRLIQKSAEGIEFFTTQVLYEKENLFKLLLDYDRACRQLQMEPKRIFLSFAPISSRPDCQFLKWLGVDIPESVESNLFQSPFGVGLRSLEISKTILREILDFVESNEIRVPLGLNIEYVKQQNFERSEKFVNELGLIYNEHLQEKQKAGLKAV